MPNDSNPIDGQPWPLSAFLRDSPLWTPSGVVGPIAGSSSAGDLGLSFDIVSGTSVTPKLALGRGRVRGGRFERTGSPWTSGMSGTAPQQGSAAYSLNTASNPRRDRVVLRRDAALQAVYPIILPGTPAATPQPVALTQIETGVWEAALFSWTLPGGSSTTPANVVDERTWLDPAGSGYLGNGPITTTADTVGGDLTNGLRGLHAGVTLTRGYPFTLKLYAQVTAVIQAGSSATIAVTGDPNSNTARLGRQENTGSAAEQRTVSVTDTMTSSPDGTGLHTVAFQPLLRAIGTVTPIVPLAVGSYSIAEILPR